MQTSSKTVWPLLLLIILPRVAWCQWTKEFTQRGFISGAAFDVSTVDSVDTVNGNVVMRIPLAALPAGRAGMGANVTLTYNSGIFNSLTDYLINGMDYSIATRVVLAGLGDASGVWGYGYNYGLYMEARSGQPVTVTQGESSAFYPDGCVPTGTGQIDMARSSMSALYPLRMRAVFPDGSTHVLALTNSTPYANGDGWSSVNSLGMIIGCFATANNPPPTPLAFPLHYVTTDGTFVRVSIAGPDPLTGGAAWTMTFPDGQTVTGVDLTTDHIYDRNGNGVTISHTNQNGACYPFRGDPTDPLTTIKDSYSRCVQIEYGVTSHWISQTGAQGSILTSTVNFTNVAMAFNYSYGSTSCQFGFESNCSPYNPNPPPCLSSGTCTPMLAAPVVSSVDLSQAGFTSPLSFSFAYNSNDTSCQSHAPLCQGQLTDVTLPHGVFLSTAAPAIHYAFDVPGSLAPQDMPLLSKTLTHYDPYTSQQYVDTWTYSVMAPLGGVSNSVTNPDGSKTIYSAFDPYSTPLGGHTFKVDKLDASNHLLSRVEQKWTSGTGPFGGDPNIFLNAEFRSVAPLNGTSPSLSAVKIYTQDVNGNTLSVDESDWINYATIAALNHGPSEDITQLPAISAARSTLNTYYVLADAGSNVGNAYWTAGSPRILNAKKSMEILDHGSPFAYSELVYDDATGASMGSSGAGNVTQEWRWDSTKSAFPGATSSGGAALTLSTSSAIETVQTYTLGDVVTETDPRGTLRLFQYNSSAHPYPTDLFEANGTSVQQHWQFGWDSSSGLRTSETDPNGAVTAATYDPRGRQTSFNQASLRRTNTLYDDAGQIATAKQDLSTPGDGLVQKATFTDDLGRMWKNQNTDASCPGTVTQTIDVRQTPASGGFSYELMSNPFCGTGDSTMGWTRTKSDPLGRVVEVAHFSGADLPAPWGTNASTSGSVITSYDANQYTVTDEAGVSRTMTLDGMNRLQGVNEAAVASTSYTYDALNNLTGVNQGGLIRSFVYSSLGRLQSTTNPESNTVSYTYDANGNLFQRTDARNITTTITSDLLNRPTLKSYSDNTPKATYCYDGLTFSGVDGQCSGAPAPPFLGRLRQMASSVSITSFSSYDLAGRVLASTQSTNSADYTFTYAYNMLDGLTRESYPSGRVVSYAYNAAGQISRVANGELTSPKSYASNITYSPHHSIATLPLGNGLTETRSYNARLQPTQIQAGTAMTLKNCYDSSQAAVCSGVTGLTANNNGNVMGQLISGVGLGTTVVQNYSYDGLNRLSSFTETGNAANQTYGLDPLGNRWVGSGWVPYPAQTPQSNVFPNNRWADGSGVNYDAAGNQTSISPGRSFQYDAEDRQTSATINSSVTAYSYDGDGRRITKSVDGALTTYVYDAMGQLAAEYGSQPTPTCKTCFFTTDHLGSTRLVTDETGRAVERYDYAPFGEELTQGIDGRAAPFSTNSYPTATVDAVSQKFTSKERDAESGLDFFDARYMSSAQGRFTSPDPSGLLSAKPQDPQSWNLYAYVRNNPLVLIDPNGLDCVNATDSQGGFSVNHDTNSGACGKGGGTWVPGYVDEKWVHYNNGTGMYQVGSIDGAGKSATVDYALFAAGAETNDKGKCLNGCDGYGFASANANWLQGQLVGSSKAGGLDGYIQFLTGREQPLGGGLLNKLFSGPLDISTDHWAGPGGMGPPGGRGDWAASVHDYNFSTNGPSSGQGITIGNYFNPTLSPATSRALIQSNSTLIRNAGGIQGVKMGIFFGAVNAFQWYSNSWK